LCFVAAGAEKPESLTFGGDPEGGSRRKCARVTANIREHSAAQLAAEALLYC